MNHKREVSDNARNAAFRGKKGCTWKYGLDKKKKIEDCPKKMKRNRRSNSETLEFLREKMEPDKENRSMQYEQKRNQTDLVIAMLQKMLAVMKSLAEKKN